MAREWMVACKDCGKDFGYSHWSYEAGAARGQSRPERCPDCRRRHNSQTATMGVAYFDLKPRAAADTLRLRPGRLGALSHPMREHAATERPGNFDPSKFGLTDDDVRELCTWLNHPDHQVAVVVGPTGSGKSTALPYRLIAPPDGIPEDLFTKYGQIVVTQPRIQATRNIPAYVAKDLYGSSIGSGFDIGFRYKNNPYSDWRNRLVYVTDGTLINWIVTGQIANLSAIMIDEAHERSLNIDLILGLLKKLLPIYPHLKLIIASATIDSGLFLNYFGAERTALIEFKGMRKFNVTESYRDEGDPLPYHDLPKLRRVIASEVAAKVVWLLEQMAEGKKETGDILGFLQGERPIDQAVDEIRAALKGHSTLAQTVDVYPLYTTLPQEDQNKALLPKPDQTRRRVVITTNVAETSLTVEGIVYVVDSGLINESQWSPQSETKQVVAVVHSQAGCKQRWGRAGRIRDGEAYCLYSKAQFNDPALFPPYTTPQIQRSALDQIVLTAKAAGIDDLSSFDWIQSPPTEELERAPRVLQKIGALDADGDLTEHGLELQTFADEPALANLLAVADRFACAIEVATILPMIKLGGPRHLLRWEREWDATTRREVSRIHRALRQGCRDDIEFCLKLYVAWSETRYDDEALAPDWAFHRVWPRFVPQITTHMHDELGPDGAARFRAAAEETVGYNGLCDLTEEFGVGEAASEWLAEAGTAIARAEREAWARAFFVNHSVFRNKIEPEREILLEALSGHKKEEERRPIDFDLVERVRLVFAYCLPERRYVGYPAGPSPVAYSGSEATDLFEYRPRGRKPTDSNENLQGNIVVQINQDSVCFQRPVEAFVCGTQQVIVRRLSPELPPVPILYVSFLSLLDPAWLEWLETPGRSLLALGRFMAAQMREEDTGELRPTSARGRLFVDQRFPIGSRYRCRVTSVGLDDTLSVALVGRYSDPPEILEDFRGAQPDATEVADAVDETDATPGELADTVLTADDLLVANPEEDVQPPWVHLADDLWEVDLDTSSPTPSRFGGGPTRELLQDSAPTRRDETGGEDLAPLAIGRVDKAAGRYGTGDEFVMEVTDYDFSQPTRPIVIGRPAPERDPNTAFSEQYQAGDSVTVVAVAHDERPGDALVSLIVREPASGLEVLVEGEQLAFTYRGFVPRLIPLGAELQMAVERIDTGRRRVYLSGLSCLEILRDEHIIRQRRADGMVAVEAVVREHADDRVLLTLGWSDPSRGLIDAVSVRGPGLSKAPEEYSVGETCSVLASFNPFSTFRGLSELDEEVATAIAEQRREFQRLAWDGGELKFHGRMTDAVRRTLRAASTDRQYQRAIDQLYRFSNNLRVQILNTERLRTITETYPVGTRTAGLVLRKVDVGVVVQLEPGVEGLVHSSEIDDSVELQQDVTVAVIRLDSETGRLGLSLSRSHVLLRSIPQDKVGLAMGRNGATISRVRAETGTNIDIRNQGNEGGRADVVIWGSTAQAAEMAWHMLGGIIDPHVGTIAIPKSRLGLLFGRGGSTIERIKSETGTRIGVNNDSGEVRVEGNDQDGIDRALRMIEQNVRPYGATLSIPQGKIGLLIGSKGTTINSIKAATNTDILIVQDMVKGGRVDVQIWASARDSLSAAAQRIQAVIPDAQ